MSIKLSGPVLIVTGATTVASNLPAFSLIGRFMLDPAMSAPANAGRIFRTQTDSVFNLSFDLVASPTNTRLQMIGQSGGGNVVTHLQPIRLGQARHFAGVWNQPASSQKIYIDGVPVASNTLTVNTATHNNQIEIGAAAQSATTTLYLAELRLFNVALTDADVLADSSRTTLAQTTYPSNFRWGPPLTGTNGATVQVGDPGLVDAGSVLKNLITISGSGTATWSNNPLDTGAFAVSPLSGSGWLGTPTMDISGATGSGNPRWGKPHVVYGAVKIRGR